MTISIIGLGKLGASMTAAIASRGIKVIGVDVNAESVRLINEGVAPVIETALDELLKSNMDRVRATTSVSEAVAVSDITFIIVPTPSVDDGSFTLQFVRQAMKQIGAAIQNKSGYHLVCVTSTVLPGSCRYSLIPTLEKASGKRAGADFGVCYSPEFIALGSVIHDFLNPDFTLIGEHDVHAGDMLETFYRVILPPGTPCKRMSLESAELAKIALNSYVTTKITFANTLARICDRLPHSNVDHITDALGCDARIGRKYLSGGLGFSGPCFPRDNRALSFVSNLLGVNAQIAGATDYLNETLVHELVEKIANDLPHGSQISILGLSYKPGTPVVESSQAIQLANHLHDAGFNVVAYDPLAYETAKPHFSQRLMRLENNLSRCLMSADAVLVLNADSVFKQLTVDDFNTCHYGVIVWDIWRILPQLASSLRINYRPWGVNKIAESSILKETWEK